MVEPGDPAAIREKILALYNGRDMMERMGAAAKLRVRENFTIEKTALEPIAVYRDMLNDAQG